MDSLKNSNFIKLTGVSFFMKTVTRTCPLASKQFVNITQISMLTIIEQIQASPL